MPRQSDYLSAAVWAGFGLIVAIASWRLDRLESLSINPWSVPGLLPGLVGVLIMVLALVLALQARRPARGQGEPGGLDGLDRLDDLDGLDGRDGREGSRGPGQAAGAAKAGAAGSASRGRTLVAGALCVLFAGVALGHGLPFFAEAAAFLFLFITTFSWPEWRARSRVARGLASALLIALAAAGVISWLFESVFLVRLP